VPRKPTSTSFHKAPLGHSPLERNPFHAGGAESSQTTSGRSSQVPTARRQAAQSAGSALPATSQERPSPNNPAPTMPPHSGRQSAAPSPAEQRQVSTTQPSRTARGYPPPPKYNEQQRAEIAEKVATSILGPSASEPKRGAYPAPVQPDEASKNRAASAAAASKAVNLEFSNPNVAVHASNALDGQTGRRARLMPQINALFSKTAAEELDAGNKLAERLQSTKDQVDSTNNDTHTGSNLAESGQSSSSWARLFRGVSRAGQAASTVTLGNPVVTAGIGVAGGVAETGARVKASSEHAAAAASYEQGAQATHLSMREKATILSESAHQSNLSQRAQRQATKSGFQTLFAATPGINFMATGAEQTATGYAAEAVASEAKNLSGASRVATEAGQRSGEVVASEVEMTGLGKATGGLSKRILGSRFGGIGREAMQTSRVNRVRELQSSKIAHTKTTDGHL